MSYLSSLEAQPILPHQPVLYSYPDRLLRLCVFQAGIYSQGYPGWFERIIHRIYLVFSKCVCSSKLFNAEIAQERLNNFQTLGAEVEMIVSSGAQIQTISFRASEFRAKLEGFGASWDKRNVEGKEVLAITPPAEQPGSWQAFEAQMIARFKWEKLDSGLIITCKDASSINLEQSPKLFVHCNSASTVSCMLGSRIGFWLGCGQDICLYDPRGTWNSSGVPSEGGYYQDADAVLQHEIGKGDHNMSDVWVTAACGGSCVAGYLKKEHHAEGINMMVESGYVNLNEDFVAHQAAPVRWFVNRYHTALYNRIIDVEGPRETGFKMDTLWEDLKKHESSRVVVIYPENDEYLPTPATPDKMVTLAKKVNYQGNVSKISFLSTKKYPHRDRFYDYNGATTQVLQSVFRREE